MPDVTTPSAVPAISARFRPVVSANCASAFMRSSTTTWRRTALAGAAMYFGPFFSYSFSGSSCRGSSSVRLWEWATRVQVRRSTGVSNCSDSS